MRRSNVFLWDTFPRDFYSEGRLRRSRKIPHSQLNSTGQLRIKYRVVSSVSLRFRKNNEVMRPEMLTNPNEVKLAQKIK